MHFRNGWKKKKKKKKNKKTRLSQILITPFSSRISVQNFFYTIITTHYDTHYNFPLFKKYIPWKLNYFKELKFNNDQSVTTHKIFFLKAKQKIKYMHGKYFDQFLEKKTDIDDNIHLKNYSESHFIWKLACLLSVNCIIVFSQQRTMCIVNISCLASLLGYSRAVGLSKHNPAEIWYSWRHIDFCMPR